MLHIRFGTRHRIALAGGGLLLFTDFFLFYGRVLFFPFLAVVVTVGWLPYWLDIFTENRRQKELEARFPEFVRNLTGAIKSGMPASQAAIHVADADYAALTPYVKKLANQLEWAIPFHRAFVNFGRETNNTVIRRAIATVIQAEEAGGNIEDVLSSITDSLVQIKKIREQRRSSIHSQVLQSYIIFFVFLGVMVLIQNLLIPYMSQFGSAANVIGAEGPTPAAIAQRAEIDFSSPFALLTSLIAWLLSMQGLFLVMSLIQGFFAGVVLGKLAEGDLTSGMKHSLIMMTSAFVIMTFSQGLIA